MGAGDPKRAIGIGVNRSEIGVGRVRQGKGAHGRSAQAQQTGLHPSPDILFAVVEDGEYGGAGRIVGSGYVDQATLGVA